MKKELFDTLIDKNDKKIVLFILDGLGDLPYPPANQTALETANCPNLDSLASKSELGLFNPIEPGITPGSGPGHLGIFGYDPIEYNIGRGVLGALGTDFDIKVGDLAARVNFCTINESGEVTDRRAGRIATEINERLCKKINDNIKVDSKVQFFFQPEKEHRALMVLRGESLSDKVLETDPLKMGLKTIDPDETCEKAKYTSKLYKDILSQIKEILKDEEKANMILLRGFAIYEKIPSMNQRFALNPIAICEYPMYRGLAKLVGMKLSRSYSDVSEIPLILKENWKENDFFFVHFKKTDSAGEDGDFEAKVKAIEIADKVIPEIESLSPDVFIVTGDHSTPAFYKNHSWHTVPFLLKSKFVRQSRASKFDEYTCQTGAWPQLAAKMLINLMLANADKLKKYGA
ncbi:MAG: 2,3-bisphosphoglycerate-independent phosphoglycerate mutase [Pseudomonadota bacterium]